ncbi:hypothetical protein GALMADRAFT_248732 [Galerina marginata CBS 339.88]|uniref:Uncharacterized protein n=1 Tax=Galerina marginata (strain CBS 339.88) TaxID=685588 RepID=A0A067SYH4_GALM3|nr:hypothetical protein GALMADRAFT_248732 [Galerina marginata CBS 339.88]
MAAKLGAFLGLGELEVDWDLVSSYAGLLGLATVSIYAGAYGSLPRRKWRDPAAKTKEESAEKVDEEDEEDMERMSSGDAWLFPIVSSVLASWGARDG